ncbi:MAG: hypothetical protein ABIU05_10145 [Nitrospirales bacterium]
MGPLHILAEPEAAVYEEWLLERLFDETVALAIKQKLVSHHTTLMHARAGECLAQELCAD